MRLALVGQAEKPRRGWKHVLLIRYGLFFLSVGQAEKPRRGWKLKLAGPVIVVRHRLDRPRNPVGDGNRAKPNPWRKRRRDVGQAEKPRRGWKPGLREANRKIAASSLDRPRNPVGDGNVTCPSCSMR